MLFDKRTQIKPYEYDTQDYIDAIFHSFRTKDEYNYTSDVNDYRAGMSEEEREVAKRCMLAISIVEVKVKSFRGDIGKHIPKVEIANVGAVFNSNEVVHFQFYSHLLDILGLNKAFEEIEEVECIKKRITYLNQCMKGDFKEKLLKFTLFIENVSLFSQFLVLMSLNKHKGYLKGMSNGIGASTLEEEIHGLFGAFLLNTIKKEYGEFFVKEELMGLCEYVKECEYEIIDRIFAKGDLDYITKDEVKRYVDYRISKGLNLIGINVKSECPKSLERFETELETTTHTDFFHKKSRNYSKKTQSFNSDDLFDL